MYDLRAISIMFAEWHMHYTGVAHITRRVGILLLYVLYDTAFEQDTKTEDRASFTRGNIV